MIKYLKIMLALAGLGGMPAIAQARLTNANGLHQKTILY